MGGPYSAISFHDVLLVATAPHFFAPRADSLPWLADGVLVMLRAPPRGTDQTSANSWHHKIKFNSAMVNAQSAGWSISRLP
jgi:hypothetical protein